MDSIRLDRRRFVAGSVMLAGSGALATAAWSGRALTPHLRVCDRRFAGLLSATERAGPVIYIDGDVTALWRDTLNPLWQHRHAVIAGLTLSSSLFCLEQLARGHRHVVARRANVEGTLASRWVIAPLHLRESV